jgi:hypothetical protein
MTNEWAQRYLCPDGSCIGVIGPDGTCKVCGRAAPNWGDERKRGMVEEASAADSDPADEGDEGDNDDADDGADDQPEAAAAAETGDPDWDRRALCSDGACIGVIVEGKCNVCGRSAA